jgi:hypothetical protein
VPDWTYHPLGPIAASAFGRRRTQVLALALLATLIRRLGGRHWIPAVFDHPDLPPSWRGRFGASVPPSVARNAITVLPVQSASIIEINQVRATDIETVRRAAAGRRCRVTAVTDTAETCRAVAPHVDAATVDDPPDTIRLHDQRLTPAAQALADSSLTVLATPAVLTEAGPAWFSRVIEAATPTSPPPPLRALAPSPLRWPGWLWAALVAVGLIVGGIGAAAITLGPVLLFYDRTYLNATITDLHEINPHLVGFLQHDRITMAGNMVGIGILYLALAQAMRQGYRWARRALLLSGAVAFGSYFYFLATGGFVEPLHTLVILALTPMWIAALARRLPAPGWPPVTEGPEPQRRRALWGQLLMIGIGGGLAVAGAVISVVGMTSVFVPTDLSFMGTHAHDLRVADPHLLPFIAHDRAGFGGALIAAGLAVLLLSMWGWRRGQRWVWWCLALGCAFGTVPVLIVHFAIGYTHFEHLLPVYLLVTATVVALTLAKPYLTARS